MVNFHFFGSTAELCKTVLKTFGYTRTPEAGARVDYPLSNLLLSHPLLHQSLLWPKQLHRQLAVRRRKDVLKLVPHTQWLRLAHNRSPERWILLFPFHPMTTELLLCRITILQILFRIIFHNLIRSQMGCQRRWGRSHGLFIRKNSTWEDARCRHPWSSHKANHGDQVSGIGLPMLPAGAIAGFFFYWTRGLEGGQGWRIYTSTRNGVGMWITFGLPSVFVQLPFGGSMITRVSIDPPSIWPPAVMETFDLLYSYQIEPFRHFVFYSAHTVLAWPGHKLFPDNNFKVFRIL